MGDGDAAQWDNRGHFFAAAAEAMRRILIEDARRKLAAKHGGGCVRLELPRDMAEEGPDERPELLALDEALDRLAASDPSLAELVKLRYFAGLSVEETALVLGSSTRPSSAIGVSPAPGCGGRWIEAKIGRNVENWIKLDL